MKKKVIWSICAIIGFAVVIFVFPAPHSPAQAYARWKAFFLARSFARSLEMVTRENIHVYESMCRESDDPGGSPNMDDSCVHSRLIRQALPSAVPYGGDWQCPRIGEINRRTAMICYLPEVSGGFLTIDGRRYEYHLFPDGFLGLWTAGNEMEITLILTEERPDTSK